MRELFIANAGYWIDEYHMDGLRFDATQQIFDRSARNIMVEIGQTLASGQTLDVTNDVLTALNAALPSIATTAPAQAQPKQAQPQGR